MTSQGESAVRRFSRSCLPALAAVLQYEVDELLLLSSWFRRFPEIPNHLIETDFDNFPSPVRAHPDLRGRSVIVRKCRVVPVECVARGYLSGSGLKEYQQSGTVCGIELEPGLTTASKLREPIFTPATKEESGHDENVSFDEVVRRVGADTAAALRERSLAIYEEARAYAWTRGLVLADTKFEFGFVDGALTLIDEILSPDSSRYWDRAEYEAGRLLAFDKQYVRDWLDRSGWNHEPPAPSLSEDVAAQNFATVSARGPAALEAVLRDIRRDRQQTYAALAAGDSAVTR